MMKKYQIFLDRYSAIEEEKERLAFMRGYMLSLTPKQFQLFFDFNIKNGIAAVKEIGIIENANINAIEEIEALAKRVKAKFAMQLQAA